MLDIKNVDWEDLDKMELAKLTLNALMKSPFNQPEKLLSDIVDWLKWSYIRFKSTTFFLAYINGKLVGWLAVSLNIKPNISETWRWTPYILPAEKLQQYEIATMLLKKCVEFIKINKQTRLEVCFDKINDTTFHYYEQYRIWFEAEKFYLVDDNAYMYRKLNSEEFTQNDIILPPGYTYKPLVNVDSEELYALYIRCFKESDIRGFHDLTDDERRVDFEYYFKGTTIAEKASLVIIKDGEIIGFSLVLIRPEEAHLAEFGIDPVYRGRGLGRRLLKHSILEAAQSFNIMSLAVDINNISAYRLYEEIGFKVEYRLITHAWKHE